MKINHFIINHRQHSTIYCNNILKCFIFVGVCIVSSICTGNDIALIFHSKIPSLITGSIPILLNDT